MGVCPVALAVCVGQFAADWATDLLRPDLPVQGSAIVVADVPEAADMLTEPLPAAPAAADAAPLVSVLPAPTLQADPGPDADAVDPARVVDSAPARTTVDGDEAGVRSLPGPATARQAGAGESCIHRTVATRSPNGWEQALENDAPVPCTASSP